MMEGFPQELSIKPVNKDFPSISLTDQGWILRWNNDEVLVFDDILSGNADTIISEKLGLEPKREAWKLKAQALENWPQTLDDVRKLFPEIIGEDDNVKLMILALFSLKLRRPEDRIMGIIIESANSAGKSHLAKSILRPLRVFKDLIMEFTRLTGAYLERKFQNVNLDRKILFLQESSNAPSQLHLTLSEGKLRVGLLIKNNGDFQPVEIEADGQPFLLATTTNWRGSPDLIHRCILMGLDESASQTYRITEFEAKLDADFIYRERFRRFCEGCLKLFRKLWKEAPENIDVVVPFLPLVEKKLRVKDPDIKLRRDFKKLIALIKGSAILFHKHRKIIEVNGAKIIIADLKDFYEVLPLFKTSLKQTLTNLGEKEQRVLNVLKEEGDFSTYGDLAKLTEIPASTLRHHIIPRLEAKGFIVVDKSGKPHRIERIKEVEEVQITIDEDQAKTLIQETIERLLLFGGQTAKPKRGPETALIPENKLGELVISETAKDSSVFSEKEQGEGLDPDWPNGQKGKRGNWEFYRII